jgi:hypothetical protein
MIDGQLEWFDLGASPSQSARGRALRFKSAAQIPKDGLCGLSTAIPRATMLVSFVLNGYIYSMKYLSFVVSAIKMEKEEKGNNEIESIGYAFTKKQIRRLSKWKKNNNLKFSDGGTVEGGAFTYCFTPTSIGTLVIVKHVFGKEIDLTDFNTFA